MANRRSVLFAAAVAGAGALVAQSLLLREELILYGGNEVAIGAFLGVWLLGVSAGAIAVHRWLGHAQKLCGPLLIAQGAAPILSVLLAYSARELSGIPAYEPFPLTLLFLWSVPITLPVAAVTGALVPCFAAHGSTAGENVTGIYAAEAGGALVGGAATTLLLFLGADSFVLLLGCLPLSALGVAALTKGRVRLVTVGAVFVGVLCSMGLGPVLGRELRQQRLSALLPSATLTDVADTPTASLWLASLNNQQVMLVDGQIIAAFPDAPRVERGCGLLAAVTGGPRRVLLVGHGAVDLLPGLQALTSIEKVVWLAPDRGLVTFAHKHTSLANRGPDVEVLVGDPRSAQHELASRGPFDAVWLLVGAPTRQADGLVFAKENLQGLAELLAADGVLAVPVSVTPSYMSAQQRLAVGSIVVGLSETLPNVRLITGEDGLALATRTHARRDLSPEQLTANYAAMKPMPSRIGKDGFAAIVEPRQLALADELVESLRDDPHIQPSQIDRPLALFYNLLIRADQESGTIAKTWLSLQRSRAVLWLPLVVIGIFMVLYVGRRRHTDDGQRAGTSALLAVGGALGMGSSIVLLHLYQGLFGTLYIEVGWLFGLWMGGLAIGGLATRHLCRRHSPTTIGIFTLASLGIGCGALASLANVVIVNRAAGAIAFALAGALSGSVIPVAEALLARCGSIGGRAGIRIEAADHFGGAVSAIVIGIIAVPTLGISQSAWVTFGLALTAIAILGLLSHGSTRKSATMAATSRASASNGSGYRKLFYVLWAGSCAAWVFRIGVNQLATHSDHNLNANQLRSTNSSGPWTRETAPVVHYVSHALPSDGIAIASEAATSTKGYGGKLNLLIAADAAGRMSHVSVVEHHETPSYVDGLPELLASLRGKMLTQPISLSQHGESPGQMVDGITGATVTSRAVLSAVAACGSALAKPVFGTTFKQSSKPDQLVDPGYIYLLLCILLVPVFVRSKNRWVRRVWLGCHAVVGGSWLGVQLSTVQAFAWLRFDPELSLVTVTGVLAILLLAALLFGPIYCGYLCPAGAWQELLGIFARAKQLPAKFDGPTRLLKYVVLAVLLFGGFGLSCSQVTRIDLLQSIWATHRTGLSLAALITVGVGSLVVTRFGCRYLCPTGALLNLGNRIGLLVKLLPNKKYGACDLGVHTSRDINCLQCNRCVVGESGKLAPSKHVAGFFAVLLVALAFLAAAALNNGDDDSIIQPSVKGDVRAVDRERIRMQISTEKLSDKEAAHWHTVPP